MPLIVTELLRSMDIFEELPVEQIEKIASLLAEEKASAGTPLFQQGDAGDAMYIVTGGRVKLFTIDDSGVQKVLTHFGDGDFFGEMALLTGAPRSASAEAEEDARLLVLRKPDFDQLVVSNPVIMREMLKVVTRRQTATNVRLVEDEDGQRTAVGTGKVYVVYGPRGGSGKTTVAVNLAVAMARQNPDRVGLLDLDLTFGHVASQLGLSPTSSLADLPPESLRSLDRESLNRYLLMHSSSLRVFVGANKPEDGELVTGEHVKAALEVMKRQFLYIVIDTSSNFSEPVLAALETADKILLVCTPELNSVRDVRECQRIFSDVVHVPKDKLSYVMNQYQPFRVLANEQFEQALEVQLLADIPHGGEAGFKAAMGGQPVYLAGGPASVVKALDKLAMGLQETSGNGVAGGVRAKKGGLSLGFGRRKSTPAPRPATATAPAAAPAATVTMGYPVNLTASRPERSSRVLALLRLPLLLFAGLATAAGLPVLVLFPGLPLVVVHAAVATLLVTLAMLLVVPAWFAILVSGRTPKPLFSFTANALRLYANAWAYGALLTDQFSSLSGSATSPRVASYPVQVSIPLPERRSRLSVLGRAILLTPHLIVSLIHLVVFSLVSFAAWLVVLVSGRYPAGLFSLVLRISRYFLRLSAYTLLLVDRYPPFNLRD